MFSILLPSTETVTIHENTTTVTETDEIAILTVVETEFGNLTEFNASVGNLHVNDGEVNGSLPVPFTGWMSGLIVIGMVTVLRKNKRQRS